MIYAVKYVPKAQETSKIPVYIFNHPFYIVLTDHGWNSTYWFSYHFLARFSFLGMVFFGFIQSPAIRSLGWATAILHQSYRVIEASFENFQTIDEMGWKLLLPLAIVEIAILYYVRYLIKYKSNSPILAFLMLEEVKQKKKLLEQKMQKR